MLAIQFYIDMKSYQLDNKNFENIVLITLILSVFVCSTQSLSIYDSLRADATQQISSWTMRVRNQSYSSKVPASAIQNLIDHGVLPKNFYYRDNFLKAYQYQTEDFIYDSTFVVSSANLNNVYHTINFQGLDTHCQVILNGQKILQSHNMYRRYEVDVRLRNINNLTVKFNSSAKFDKIQEQKFYAQNGFNLPKNYSFTRKAAYQYGWDWGPRILSVGIWKPVIISFYNQSKVKNFQFNQLTPIDKNTKLIQTETKVVLQKMDPSLSYEVQIAIVDFNLTKPLNFFVTNVTGFSQYQISSKWNLTDGPNMKLNDYIWWTWDLGKQNMLKIQLTVTNIRDKTYYKRQIQTGLRTVKLNQTQSYNGTSFTINLNGIDIYMRGGNYIPPEMSLARTNSTIYQKTIKNARDQNFNMIRVWGGGQFEKDWFYQQCDRAGILIWHDLMFACALYPYNYQIDSNIQAQMLDNLKRLKHHPSIGLWNGNNQVWIGWQEWGWKNNKTQPQKQKVQQMYAGVFKVVLPNTINKITPNIPYWETSPSVSSNHPQTILSGDIHFWRVWGGGTPIQQYQQFVGRFNSQYGMQSMPDISTIQKFTSPQDRQSLSSFVLRLHQRHPKGDQYLPMYVKNYTGQTQNLTRFSYFSQVMQAYALGLAISSLRGSKPFNMGSLYWQLNDVWPVSSWATIDYYQVKKAAHYTIKKMYQPLLFNCHEAYTQNSSNSSYRINVINDYNKQFNAIVKISIRKLNGEIIYSQTIKNYQVKSLQNQLISQLPKQKYQTYQKDCFISVEANYSEIQSQYKQSVPLLQNYQRNVFFPVKPKDRNIIDPKLKYSVNVTSKTITLSSENIATYVWIFGVNGTQSTQVSHLVIGLQNDENYLTLLPNQSRTLNILYEGDLSSLKVDVTSYELQVLRQSKNMSKDIQRRDNLIEE